MRYEIVIFVHEWLEIREILRCDISLVMSEANKISFFQELISPKFKYQGIINCNITVELLEWLTKRGVYYDEFEELDCFSKLKILKYKSKQLEKQILSLDELVSKFMDKKDGAFKLGKINHKRDNDIDSNICGAQNKKIKIK